MSADLFALLVLACATYATRAAGVFIAGRIRSGGRIDRLLTSLSGCVLASLVTPAFVLGDAGLRVGVLAALLAFLLLRHALLAMASAVIVTAVVRSLWSFSL